MSPRSWAVESVNLSGHSTSNSIRRVGVSGAARSRRYADPAAYLLTPDKWSLQRTGVRQLVGKPTDPDRALAGARQELDDTLGGLEEVVAAGDRPVRPGRRRRAGDLAADRRGHPGRGHRPEGRAHDHAALAHSTNLGLTRMSDACEISYDTQAWTSEWYVRETLRSANLAITGYHQCLPLTRVFGAGTLSSPDGQRFPTSGKSVTARAMSRYFAHEGLPTYTHVADQHTTYGTKVIVATERDAHYVLDEILGNATDAPISAHATDTHGVTPVNFGLFDLLGMQLSPRIRDISMVEFAPGYDRLLPLAIAAQRTVEMALALFDQRAGRPSADAPPCAHRDRRSGRAGHPLTARWSRPPQAVTRLRATRVAHRVLSDRDEHLAAIERWLGPFLDRIDDRAERKIVRGFVTWHHLRRLRRGFPQRRSTFEQAVVVKREARVAVRLLDWLHTRGQSLAGCGQGDIDRAGRRHQLPAQRPQLRAVVRPAWTRERYHDSDLCQGKSAFGVHRGRRTLAPGSSATARRATGHRRSSCRLAPAARCPAAGADRHPAPGPAHPAGHGPWCPTPPGRQTPRTASAAGRAAVGRTIELTWLLPGGAPGRPTSARQLMRRSSRLGTQHG